MQMIDSFEYFILLGFVFVQDPVFQQILDDENECALALLIKRHYCIDMVLLIGSLSEDSNNKLEHFQCLFHIVVFGNLN